MHLNTQNRSSLSHFFRSQYPALAYRAETGKQPNRSMTQGFPRKKQENRGCLRFHGWAKPGAEPHGLAAELHLDYRMVTRFMLNRIGRQYQCK